MWLAEKDINQNMELMELLLIQIYRGLCKIESLKCQIQSKYTEKVLKKLEFILYIIQR